MTPKERISTVRRWLWVTKWYICTESIGRRRRENAYPTLYGILWVFRTLLEKVKKKGRLLCLNLAVYRRITATSHRISTEITQRAPRILGFFSSHNVYYVKITILLDNWEQLWYTDYVDSHRGFLEYQRGRSSLNWLRKPERSLREAAQSIWQGLWDRTVCRGGFVFCVFV